MIEADRKALLAALHALKNVIPARSSNPLITGVHVEPIHGALRLTGSGQDLDLQLTAPASCVPGPALLIPYALLTQAAEQMSAQTLTLDVRGARLRLLGGHSHYDLTLGEPDAYPLPHFAPAGDGTLPGADLARLIGSVRYAAAHESYQGVLRGLHVTRAGTVLTVQASDGYRLARNWAVVPGGPDFAVVAPARSADEIARVFADQTVSAQADAGLLTLRGPQARMNVRLLDGAFPDTQRVIPPARKEVTFDAAALHGAAGRCALLTERDANYRLTMRLDGTQAEFTCASERGRAREVLSCVGVNGRFEADLNARFLLDALGGLQGDVTLGYGTPREPLTLTSPADRARLSVMVPLA